MLMKKTIFSKFSPFFSQLQKKKNLTIALDLVSFNAFLDNMIEQRREDC